MYIVLAVMEAIHLKNHNFKIKRVTGQVGERIFLEVDFGSIQSFAAFL